MTYLLGRFEIDDYEAWKRDRFDADPAGREQAAKGHRILRSLDNPKEVFVQVEFGSADEARAFRQNLKASRALEFEGLRVLTEPQIAEEIDAARY